MQYRSPFSLSFSSRSLFLVPAALALASFQPVVANVAPSALFADNMVLQRDMQDPVWGTAGPGEKVTVSLTGQSTTTTANTTTSSAVSQTLTTTAGADGKWMVRLQPLKAADNMEITIRGNNTITLKNVAVGEVWLCSGQSNMEFRVPRTMNAEDEIAAANYPLIRQFKPRSLVASDPQTDTTGQWAVCSPTTVSGFTAVGYFFARDIYKALGVPIGIIHSSWGGTPAEAWTSRPALQANPELNKMVVQWDQRLADYPNTRQRYADILQKWRDRVTAAKAAGKPTPRKPADFPGPRSPGRPSGLYNGMIAPLIPYGIKGVIWYQGESNAGNPAQYLQLFPTLIRDWRKNWGEGDFPFLFVQLANFKKPQVDPSEGGWALLREAQMLTLALPNTGMATAIDIGDAGNIHPTNKQEVGRRLSLWALANTYGKPMEVSGPLYESMTVEGSSIRLHFKHVDGGLIMKGDKLAGFAIAGADGKFVWANARIDGDSVVVSSDAVPNPTTVRYGWANNPILSLYNKAGLPASSFRTDAPPAPAAI